MPTLKRAKSVTEIYAKKRNILQFSGDWLPHIGNPEIKGSWFVYGHSGNGKTSYLVQMAKMLTQYGKVWYNGLEEGDSESFRQALQRVGMETCGSKFQLIEDTPEELKYRLSRRNRARFVIIDSLPLFLKNIKQYLQLQEENKGVQFIYVGHAEGKKPEGRLGKKVEYLSFVKIWVQGFKAFPKSRYGGIEPFVIYPKRAAEAWQDIIE